MGLSAKRFVPVQEGENVLTIKSYKESGDVINFTLESEGGDTVGARYDRSTRMGNDFFFKFMDTFIPYMKGKSEWEDDDIIGAKAVCEVKLTPKTNKENGQPIVLKDGTTPTWANLHKVLREAE